MLEALRSPVPCPVLLQVTQASKAQAQEPPGHHQAPPPWLAKDMWLHVVGLCHSLASQDRQEATSGRKAKLMETRKLGQDLKVGFLTAQGIHSEVQRQLVLTEG